MSELEVSAGAAEAGERLDRVLAARYPDLSRAHLQSLIESGEVVVNGAHAKSGLKLRAGDSITGTVTPPRPLYHLVPENIPLDIIYEDADILVVNKPAGMVVHPAPGHASGTLVNALLARVPALAEAYATNATPTDEGDDDQTDSAESSFDSNGTVRPGIVHRLDKDTSGLLVVAKNDAAQRALVAQMKAHTMLKEYLTLVEGSVQPPAGVIDAPIGRDPAARKEMTVMRPSDVPRRAKEAQTTYEVLEYLARHSYVSCRLRTGRTHQIRVHMAWLGHAVVGDQVYGRRKTSLDSIHRQFLHAARLGLHLPGSGEWREFVAPLPADLDAALTEARALTQ